MEKVLNDMHNDTDWYLWWMDSNILENTTSQPLFFLMFTTFCNYLFSVDRTHYLLFLKTEFGKETRCHYYDFVTLHKTLLVPGYSRFSLLA